MKIIRRIIWQWRKYIAIKTAIKAHEADGRKYLVIVLEGKPTVVSKGELRKLKAKGAFKKGVTLQDFEKRALFVSK
jgi:hypothetical protein